MVSPQVMRWAPPAILDFIDAAHAALVEFGPDHLPALAPAFASLFRQRDILDSLANACLRRVVEGAMNGGDPAVNVDMLLMCYSPRMTLRMIKDRSDLGALSARPWTAALCNYPANTLIYIHSARPVTVDWYELAPGADFDLFDASLRIRHAGRECFSNGSVVQVDARRRFPVLPDGCDAVYIVLAGAPVNAQVVSFDAAALTPLGASMASEEHSVLCVMLGLLDARRQDYPLAQVTGLAAHPDHHVRWAAATALGRHSRDAAVALVRQLAAHDPHRFVRTAACRTLQHCGAEQ